MQSFNRGEWEHFLAAPSDSTGPRRNTLKLRPNQRHPGLQVLGSMLALASVLPLTIGSQALAQAAPAAPAAAASAPKDAARKDDDVKQLESVTITAQKRKQSILDVAASVTVIGEETITQNNIQGIKDFFALTPNVNAQEGGGGGPRSTLITMRGIADQGAGGERVAAVSAFGFYVNELSIGNAATDTANPPLYDIQSIEVLRGPQGTYFGRNASGGVINIQTHKPEKNFFGQADFGLGTQNTVLAAGIINVPISDTLFVRQSIQSQRDTGFVKNSSALAIVERDDADEARPTFRLALIEERKPVPGLPLKPEVVAGEFADLFMPYGTREFVTDSHEVKDVDDALLGKGCSVIPAPPPAEAFKVARNLIHEGRFKAAPNPRLRAQLRVVTAKPMPGGGTQIASPKSPDGSHGDLVSALVRAIWRAEQGGGAVPAIPRPTRLGPRPRM